MWHRHIDMIVIHHAAADKASAEDINEWHKERGFWGTAQYGSNTNENKITYNIGYHFVIRKSGKIEQGKPLDLMGEHAGEYNAHSIGICLEGTGDGKRNTYTTGQIGALVRLTYLLKMLYPAAEIRGHKELDARKPYCPSLNMTAFRSMVAARMESERINAIYLAGGFANGEKTIDNN